MIPETYRVIGFLIGSLFIMLSSLNVLDYILSQGDARVLHLYTIIISLAMGLILIIVSAIKKESFSFKFRKRVEIDFIQFSKVIQFFFLSFFTIIEVIQNTNTHYPLSMVIITIMLGYRYQLLGKPQLIIIIALVVLLFQVTSLFSLDLLLISHFILHFFFVTSLLILLFHDLLRNQFHPPKEYADRRSFIFGIFNETKEEYIVDVASIDFTARELEVLKELCIYRGTNKDIGEKLDIKPTTVKVHLSRIYDKVGVDSRHQLIDICKDYFDRNAEPNS